MKLRTHTVPLPTDYVSQLRNQGKRKKSRCFIEYFYDIEVGEHNSYSFYAKSWEVGKGTAYRWVEEFNEALEIFDAARELKRKVHYQKAIKKDGGELCPKSDGTNGTIVMERLEHHQEPIVSTIQKSSGTIDISFDDLIKEFLDDLNKNLNQNIQKEVLTIKTGAFSNEKKELMVIYNPNSLFQNIKANFENKINKIKMEIIKND